MTEIYNNNIDGYVMVSSAIEQDNACYLMVDEHDHDYVNDMFHIVNKYVATGTFSPSLAADCMSSAIARIYPDWFDDKYGDVVGVMASMLAWAVSRGEFDTAWDIVIELGRYM